MFVLSLSLYLLLSQFPRPSAPAERTRNLLIVAFHMGAQHDGEQPRWSGKQSQKKEFLKTIDQARRHGDEENYAEAMEKAYLACQVTKVRPHFLLGRFDRRSEEV